MTSEALQEIYRLMSEHFGPQHGQTLRVRGLVAHFYDIAGMPEKAAQYR